MADRLFRFPISFIPSLHPVPVSIQINQNVNRIVAPDYARSLTGASLLAAPAPLNLPGSRCEASKPIIAVMAPLPPQLNTQPHPTEGPQPA